MGERTVYVSAPAKVNLGLEILSRRRDGLHEVFTVMSMVDLNDDLWFTLDPQLQTPQIDGVEGVGQPDNLISKAIRVFQRRTGARGSFHIRVVKRIPIAAGLGGASSNAAAALLAANRLHGEPLSLQHLMDAAAVVGSDVPFFLGSPTATATGTGTTLEPIPNPSGCVLIVAPHISITRKTAMLYGSLLPEDYSDGDHVRHVIRHLRAGEPLAHDHLVNAFERPLQNVAPAVRNIGRAMHEAGCEHVSLSGAGPAHYSILESEAVAHHISQRLRPVLRASASVIVVPFRHRPLMADVG